MAGFVPFEPITARVRFVPSCHFEVSDHIYYRISLRIYRQLIVFPPNRTERKNSGSSLRRRCRTSSNERNLIVQERFLYGFLRFSDIPGSMYVICSGIPSSTSRTERESGSEKQKRAFVRENVNIVDSRSVHPI